MHWHARSCKEASREVSSDSAKGSKKSRAVTSAKILTWLAVALLLIVLLIVPRGITVPWEVYLALFSPVVVTDLSALILFAYCRFRRQAISPAYALMTVAVIVGVWYTTWFQLRLRWFEVFR
jgi:hypothetical protein